MKRYDRSSFTVNFDYIILENNLTCGECQQICIDKTENCMAYECNPSAEKNNETTITISTTGSVDEIGYCLLWRPNTCNPDSSILIPNLETCWQNSSNIIFLGSKNVFKVIVQSAVQIGSF